MLKRRESETSLVVDATGVGKAVVDLLHQADLEPIAVTIHGGDIVNRDGWHYRVPKRDLVGVLQVLLQTERLKIANALPMAATLVEELLNFKVSIDPRTTHDSYSAWRESMMIWYWQRCLQPGMGSTGWPWETWMFI